MGVVKRNYVITGLPRSMTAWFANFFSYGQSHCWHEALKYCAHIDEIPYVMDSNEFEYVGNSDSGWPLFHGKVALTDPRYVIIWRNVVDSKRSVAKVFGAAAADHVDLLHHQLKKLATSVPCFQLTFEEAQTERGAISMWNYIFGGALPFPMARYVMLSSMKIEVLPELELPMGDRPASMLIDRLVELNGAAA